MSHLTLGLNEKVSFDTPIAGKVQSNDIPLETYIQSVSDLGFIDTGLMARPGTGLINYRRAVGWESFVFQVEAGEHMIIWGKGEGDPQAKKLAVAMPYRIIMGDHKFHNGKWHLIGARHFYSPKPIKSWSDLLYHCNVPNLNCRGYSGTGVGWICLYHTGNYTNMDLMQRCIETSMRTSGGEAYNDLNMSRTDGARFYQAHSKPSYFWDPKEWAAKTKKEGWKWVVDEAEKLLLPVKLNNPAKNPMDKDAGGSGKPASVFDLTRGLYSAYYNDQMHLKPANLMDPNNPFVQHYPSAKKQQTYAYIVEYTNSLITTIKGLKAPGWAPKIEMLTCAFSGDEFTETSEWTTFLDSDNVLKLINSATKAKHINSFGVAFVDFSKITVHPDVLKIKEKVMGHTPTPPTVSSYVSNITCKKDDIRSVKSGLKSGLRGSRWYHKTVETRECSFCHGNFMTTDSMAPKPGSDRCARCVNVVKCPTCDRSTKETDIKTIDRLIADKIGVERFKEVLELSLKKGTDISDLESITISAPKMSKVICCSRCISTLTQCLCGSTIPTASIASVHTSTQASYATQCPSCAPENKEYVPKPKSSVLAAPSASIVMDSF